AQAQTRIGIVDLQRALNEVEEGKIAKAQLKKDFDQKQKQLDAKQEELRKLKAELDKQAVVMAEDAKRAKAAEFEKKLMETQQFYAELQKGLSESEQKATGGIIDKMAKLTAEIAEAEGLTLVLSRNDAGILYAPSSLDITNELVRKYNQRFPAGGKAPAAKPATPAPAAKK
ncbi:MAG TPA: OmpH family outer membrane protein, partial [Anaeromyxobacteraceae bacterium]|nr:OmpH family outer membrane protein [Anaeromyxobacteraceae bacterium]